MDGGNVVAEQTGTEIVSYLRGINLISKTVNSAADFYLFNAHGDVVNLVGSTGTTIKSYDYDAFGNERNPDEADTNPFRYCGEYWDTETGTYYLRARYYAPDIGRFTQADTHWNTSNMIYGDNPQKINEQEDKLGLKSYSYAPQITAIMQAGNLYVYGVNNPVVYSDPTGQLAFLVVTALIGLAFGATAGGIIAHSNGYDWWKGALLGAGIGGIIGLSGGAAIAYFAAGSATASVGAVVIGVQLKIAGIATTGYASFEAFKRAYGSAGKGRAWHHIVEQTPANIAKFGAEMLHNAMNIVNIPHGAHTLHSLISAHYSSIIPSITNGLTIRAWLAQQSFEFQLHYGLELLAKLAKELGITIYYAQ